MIKHSLNNDVNSSQLLVKSNVVSIYTQKGTLNPVDAHFDFSLWARAVREQMLAVVERKS